MTDLSLIILPFHLLGLKALIGDIDNFWNLNLILVHELTYYMLYFQQVWKLEHHQRSTFYNIFFS